jgi:hypothetical protein
MTRLERRGKWLFLTLATLIVLEKLVGVGFALSEGLVEINWFRSVVSPIGVFCAIVGLWQGDEWLRRLVGGMFLLMGASQLYLSIRSMGALERKTPPGDANVLIDLVGTAFLMIGAFAVIYLIMGLLFLLSPSMKAFFRYQREGPQWQTDSMVR